MKMVFLCVCIFAFSICSIGDVVSVSTVGHVATVTNSQNYFNWTAKAVIVRYSTPVSAGITITRTSTNAAVVLTSNNVYDATSAIWHPSYNLQFPTHCSLVVSSSVPGFLIELHREPAP